MKYKVRLNIAMSYVLLAYIFYMFKNFNSIVLVAGIIFFSAWFCLTDRYYLIERGNLIAHRIIRSKEVRIRDINALIDPIPVMHRLNPKPGTLAIYYNERKKRLHVCPKDQVGFCKAMQAVNKKMIVDVRNLKEK